MRDEHFMKMAKIAAEASTCISYKVGVVLVKDNRVVSTGRNGAPSGHEHCCDHFKKKWGEIIYIHGKLEPLQRAAHREWSKRYEVHAEANAIAYAARAGTGTEGATLYCTLSPCEDCQKLIIAAGIKRVVYLEEYDAGPGYSLLKKSKIKVEKYEENPVSTSDAVKQRLGRAVELCDVFLRKLSGKVRLLRR